MGNANYAWIEHIISKLSPKGVAGFVLANGSMSTSTTAEAAIRKNIIEDGNLVDCIITLPPNLFYNVTIPACLWFLSRKRENRKDQILFIDARKLGTMIDRRHRALSDEEIANICDTYHSWRDGKEDYSDQLGFCKAASLDEVRGHEYILTPGRYVGMEEQEEDVEPFDERMTRLTGDLAGMFAKSHELEEEIRTKLGAIGYEL